MKSFKFISFALVAFSLMTFLSSCSVVMAARKTGTSVDSIQTARCRAHILSYGPNIISSETLSTGELVETYQFKKEQGSAARAFMHGMLDVSTFGLWEVVGTPVEVCINEEKFYVVKIYYDQYESIKKIELM